jgi:hypothetical protein
LDNYVDNHHCSCLCVVLVSTRWDERSEDSGIYALVVIAAVNLIFNLVCVREGF